MSRFVLLALLACSGLLQAQDARESRDRAPENLRSLAPPDSHPFAVNPKFSTKVGFRLVLDGDSQIVDLEPLPKQRPALVNAVMQRAITWQFRGASRDGAPVTAETTLWVTVVGETGEDGRRMMRIIGAQTGPRVSRRVVPSFPEIAVRAQRTGGVLIRASYGADGKVIAAAPVKGSDRMFARSAVRAAKFWEFEPERLDGEPQPGTVLVPIVFLLPDAPYPTLAWEQERPGLNSEPVAEDSVVTLLSQPEPDPDSET